MYHDKDGITSVQLAITLIMTVFGIGVLTLPRTVTLATGGTDGWITISLAGSLFWLFTLWGFHVVRREKGMHLFSILQRRWGRGWSKAMAFGWLAYALLFSMIEIRYFAEGLRLYELPYTPVWLTMALILLPSSFVAYKGWVALCRVNQLYLPIVAVVLLSILILSYRSPFRWENLLPILHRGVAPIFEALPQTIFSFLGFEVVLLLGSYLKEPGKGYRVLTLACSSVVGFYLAIYLMCVGTFGYRQVTNILYPFIALTENVRFPGGFFERFELVVFTVWILLLFTTIAALHLTAYLALQHLLEGKPTETLMEKTEEGARRRFVSPLRLALVSWIALFMYLFSLWPRDFNHLVQTAHSMSYAGFSYLLFTLLLLSWSPRRARGMEGGAHEDART